MLLIEKKKRRRKIEKERTREITKEKLANNNASKCKGDSGGEGYTKGSYSLADELWKSKIV